MFDMGYSIIDPQKVPASERVGQYFDLGGLLLRPSRNEVFASDVPGSTGRVNIFDVGGIASLTPRTEFLPQSSKRTICEVSFPSKT